MAMPRTDASFLMVKQPTEPDPEMFEENFTFERGGSYQPPYSSHSAGQTLPQEGGLAAPAHADHGERLAVSLGQTDIATRQRRRRGGKRVEQFLAKHIAHLSFS
jgi:hypothetical protein